MAKIKIKRTIPVYSIITDKFRKELEEESLGEIKILEDQMNMVNFQIKQLHTRFGLLANQSTKTAQDQINSSIIELNAKLDQMKAIKESMLASIQELKNKPNGEQIETGILDNYIEVEPGDNLIELFQRPKVILKDNIIQEIIE
ncbi:hypothetical protein IJS77_03930 [bacterium]|nr:hypothetical protein [bacterium]